MNQETALIVGVGPGLGAALVRRCLAVGMNVVAAARRASALAALQNNAAGRLHLRDTDATSPEAVETLFGFCEDTLETPSLVIYNAGAFQRGDVADTDPVEFERCWRIGCFGGFLVGRAAARLLAPKRRGTILFTGATASLRGSAGFVNLASPKFALRAVAQSLARELDPKGVHVAHVIIDGQIRSPRYEALLAERGPDSLLEPDAIAEAYLWLHRQPRSAWTFELDLRPWVERF